jgi:hypothetical protein
MTSGWPCSDEAGNLLLLEKIYLTSFIGSNEP